jgi:TRAP-type mannitol/chloroaromatic compound transport system permease small subunit
VELEAVEANGGPSGSYNQPLPFRFDQLTALMNALGTLSIFGLLLLINSDIVGRTVFNSPVRGTTELVSLAIVGIVFLQLPNTLWAGRFVRAELLLDLIVTRAPRLADAVQGTFHVIGAAMMAIVVWATAPEFQTAWEIGDYVGSLGDFTAPTWPVRLITVVGSACTCVTYIFLALADFRRVVESRP